MNNPTNNSEILPLRVALFGYGYWGFRLARAIHSNGRLNLTHIIDPQATAVESAQSTYPTATCERQIGIGLEHGIDLVVIASKPSQHFMIAKWALENRVPVIVAKPLTLDRAEDSILQELSVRSSTPLFVDYTYLYSSGIQAIKRSIDDGQIGVPKRMVSLRTNLGIVQSDCDVLWDLAVHDLSIIDYLFEPSSISVSVVGTRDPLSEHLSTATINVLAIGDMDIFNTISVSWFSARKSRLITIDGSLGSIRFDDTAESDKLELTSGQVEMTSPTESDQTARITSYTIGPTHRVKLDPTETLQREFDQIVDALSGSVVASSNPSMRTARIACRVGEMIDACQRSLQSDGRMITVSLQ